MRISDWSSDVCSSDLGGGAVAQTSRCLEMFCGGIVFDAIDHRAEQRVGAAGEQVADRVDGRGVGRRVVVTVVARGGATIGRDSCRGRVCPYGYNLVVAVSVNKKHNIIKRNMQA